MINFHERDIQALIIQILQGEEGKTRNFGKIWSVNLNNVNEINGKSRFFFND